MILNIYRNMLARLSMAYPSMTVLPAGDSVEDIIKAQASETALRWYWHSAEMRDVLTKMIEWLLICGNAGLHTYYDPEDKTVKTEAISPYDMFFEPGAINSEEARWCAIRHIVHRKDLQASYPEYADFIASAKTELNTMTSQMQKNVSATQGYDLKDRVEVFEIYHKDGYTGMLLADKWLYKGRWPDGTMPLQFVSYTRMPGRLWGTGLIEPLLELQVLYNRGRSQIIENAELMGNPKWLVPKTAGLSKNALSSSRPGEKVMYNANSGPAPQQVPAAPIPQYVVNNIKQISAEMLDVAGIHSTSLGKRAIGIESGAAIEALSGKDMQQLQVTQDNIERTVRNSAEIILTLMKAFYKEKRMMRILDDTGVWSLRSFRQRTLKRMLMYFLRLAPCSVTRSRTVISGLWISCSFSLLTERLHWTNSTSRRGMPLLPRRCVAFLMPRKCLRLLLGAIRLRLCPQMT